MLSLIGGLTYWALAWKTERSGHPLRNTLYYCALAALLGFLSGGLTTALVAGGAGFLIAGLFYWLLDRFDSLWVWPPIIVIGTLLGFLRPI
jgi:hypothetical protein